MTQVELPQLSLQRYVDLVKRRRWQVLPVSLLGLLIGGIVAFFIPRYYVAETELVYQGSTQGSNEEDPMRQIVASASTAIPLVVRKVITEKLKWPEALLLDDHDLEQFAKAVRNRIGVNDGNADMRRRDFAVIQLRYSDRDGRRAADFLNTLVKTWIEERLAEMKAQAEAARRQADLAVQAHSSTYETLLEDCSVMEARYLIEPDLDRGEKRAAMLARQKKLEADEEALRAKAGELAGLDKSIEQQREVLARLPERITPTLGDLEKAGEQNEELKLMVAMVARAEAAVAGFQPGTRQRRFQEQLLASQRQMLEAITPKPASGDGTIPNPAREEPQKALNESEVAREKLAAEVVALQAAVTVDLPAMRERIEAFKEYDRKCRLRDDAKQARDLALAARKAAEAQLARLTTDVPIRQSFDAVKPPRPTEPNILVVALVGCVLGLAIAIGLILLLDLLQGSFKTIDDVERGLGVPVLGAISHLETDDERQAAVRSRTRASLVAFAFVALVVAVGMVFYFDPARLPASVRDLLSLVLGGR